MNDEHASETEAAGPRRTDSETDVPKPLNYAQVEASSRRIVTTISLLFGPLGIVVSLVLVEFVYARATGYLPTGRLPPFLRVASIIELLLLLFSLANAPLMYRHLSASQTYARSRPFIKVVLASLAALGYLVVVLGAFWCVLLIHLV